MNLEDIRKAFREKTYRYTKHGVEQRTKRHIIESEVEEAVFSGIIIEEYPEDKYGPSCLIYGRTQQNRPLHVQVALEPMMSIVTAYEPDTEKWIDFIKRKEG